MNYKKVASACSNTLFGNNVIERFNSFIDDDSYTTYLAFRQECDKDNALFEGTYNSYFINNTPNDKVTNQINWVGVKVLFSRFRIHRKCLFGFPSS